MFLGAKDYALCTFLDLYFGCFVITWEHGEVVLIPIFHAGKDVFNIPSKVQFVHFAAFIQ